MKKGFLLVIDGIDGSGKTTQINLLSKYLKQKGIDFEVVSFPQYKKNEYAKEIYDYLSGKLGKINEVDPYFIAKVYALDRKTARDQIKSWLNDGKLVIANRYISSSKAHLGANLEKEKRQDFFKWLNKLEYKINGMPKEDLTILLVVDPKVGQKNVASKHKADIHENNLKHLEKANKIYLELSNLESSWVKIDCMNNGQMKNPKDIHFKVVKILQDMLLSKA